MVVIVIPADAQEGNRYVGKGRRSVVEYGVVQLRFDVQAVAVGVPIVVIAPLRATIGNRERPVRTIEPEA